jgi:hypothetical protein
MNFVHEVDISRKSPMDHLILDEDTKKLVKAMAANYTAGRFKSWSADFINGKGEGKVVLLHGKC